MKHYSKRAKRKAKKSQGDTAEPIARGPQAVRPTPERLQRGIWTEPKGMGKHEIPVADITSDVIAALLHRQQITSSQEQSARTFQAARAAYLAELPEVGGYKSCLAGEVPGYDDGDGDPQVIERYRDIESAVGRKGRLELIWVCEDQQKPRSIDVLRWALDVIGALDPPKKLT